MPLVARPENKAAASNLSTAVTLQTEKLHER